MIELTIQETLTLINFVSKACEFRNSMFTALMTEGREGEANQYQAAADQSMRILKRVDTDNPGLIALPHDGVAWKDR